MQVLQLPVVELTKHEADDESICDSILSGSVSSSHSDISGDNLDQIQDIDRGMDSFRPPLVQVCS